MLSEFDKQLLDEMQQDIPLTGRPFLVAARRLGTDEATVISGLQRLKQEGYIRRLGAFFDPAALGFGSTLCAVRVETAHLAAAAGFINRQPGVTHNYEREGEYGLWFTLQTENEKARDSFLTELCSLPGTERVLVLPAVKKYKLRVRLPLSGGVEMQNGPEPAGEKSKTEALLKLQPLSGLEKRAVAALGADLPLTAEPFRELAGRTGLSEAELLAALSLLRKRGALRRIGLVLRHRRAGFGANALAVWQVTEEALDAAGRIMAAEKMVSHCYSRATAAGWPYNLYTMLHGADRRDTEQLASRLAGAEGVQNYQLLWSVKEWKKETRQYFPELLKDTGTMVKK